MLSSLGKTLSYCQISIVLHLNGTPNHTIFFLGRLFLRVKEEPAEVQFQKRTFSKSTSSRSWKHKANSGNKKEDYVSRPYTCRRIFACQWWYVVLIKSLVKTNYKTVTSTFVVLAWGVAVSRNNPHRFVQHLRHPPRVQGPHVVHFGDLVMWYARLFSNEMKMYKYYCPQIMSYTHFHLNWRHCTTITVNK